LKTPPEGVQALLRARGMAPEEIRLCTWSDFDPGGQPGTTWLAASRSRLIVASVNGAAPAGENGARRTTAHNGTRATPEASAAPPSPRIVFEAALDEIEQVEPESAVGSGLLRARMHGEPVELVHFPNDAAFRFRRAAEKIEQLRHGEEIELTDEDEKDPARCPRCGLMLDHPGAPCPRCGKQRGLILRMVRLMRPHYAAAAGMLALLIVGVALDLVSPQLTRYLVDNVLPPTPEVAAQMRSVSGREADAMEMLLTLVAILAGVQVLRMLVSMANSRLAADVGTAITFEMRSRLVRHMQQLSLGFYDTQQVGSLVGRVAYDTESLHGFVWQLTGGLILQIVMVVGVFIMMFTLDHRLALLALLPAPLLMGGTAFFWKRIYPRYHRSWDASSRQSGALSGMLSGIRVVKAFGQEEREGDRFEEASARLQRSRRSIEHTMAIFNPVVALLFQLGGWIAWWAGGWYVLEGQMTVGELMAFFGYLFMFYAPLATLPQFTNWLSQFSTQAARIFEILDTPVAVRSPEDPVELPPVRGHLRLENITFGYERHRPVLRDVTMEVPAGSLVALVGPSGSGKSTIVNLICRFYDPDAGRVRLDGVDLRTLRKEDARRQIGVVLQESFLFRGSIAVNISYGRPDASPEDVIEAALAADCHEFILRQPHGYDTWVGDRGVGLSGGERQRVAIARVFLADPRVLIMDEATSSLDAESEAAVRGAIREVAKGRTTIAIAHRLSTIKDAERVFVMERGQIVEAGTHGELAREGGVYARLFGESIELAGGKLRGMEGAEEGEPAEPARSATAPIARRVRWITPDATRIRGGAHGMLHVERGGAGLGGIYAVRCMPVHHPEAFVSLRRAGAPPREAEVGMIRHLREWPAEARRAIAGSIGKRYMLQTIRHLNDLALEANHLEFDVETDLGPKRFTTRWHPENVQEYGARGRLITDSDQNLYLIPDVEAMEDRERRLLEKFVYW
jgi:ATP-binding cassette subfamily B protein